MLMRIYSIRDARTEAYSNPFYAHNRQSAVRLFETVVNDKNTDISRYPEDYALFEIGVFDDNSGALIPDVQPTSVITALEVRHPDAATRDSDIAALQVDIRDLKTAVSEFALSVSRQPASVPVPPTAKKGWF